MSVMEKVGEVAYGHQMQRVSTLETGLGEM